MGDRWLAANKLGIPIGSLAAVGALRHISIPPIDDIIIPRQECPKAFNIKIGCVCSRNYFGVDDFSRKTGMHVRLSQFLD
jgi:hypothetical protein